jgi:heme/copper-type cytochrome/quinol oxidase subunit 2
MNSTLAKVIITMLSLGILILITALVIIVVKGRKKKQKLNQQVNYN